MISLSEPLHGKGFFYFSDFLNRDSGNLWGKEFNPTENFMLVQDYILESLNDTTFHTDANIEEEGLKQIADSLSEVFESPFKDRFSPEEIIQLKVSTHSLDKVGISNQLIDEHIQNFVENAQENGLESTDRNYTTGSFSM